MMMTVPTVEQERLFRNDGMGSGGPILLLGDHPSYFRDGSSTGYLQRVISAQLTSDRTVQAVAYHPFRRRNLLRRIFAPMRETVTEGSRGLSGGIIPLALRIIRGRYALVHCIVVRDHMLVLLLAAVIARCRISVTMHDTLFLNPGNTMMTTVIKRLILRLSGTVLCLNQQDRLLIERSHPGIAAHIIRHGIEAVELRDSPNDSKTVVFGGGIGDPVKGLEILERACQSITPRPDLRIFGPNPRGEQNPAYCGEMERISFAGQLRQARVTVVPSRYESFSMIALESMSLGVPVILTDRCGIADHLRTMEDCIVVPYGDVARLSDALRLLLENDALWMTISRNGSRTAETFRWNTVMAEYRTIFNAILSAKEVQV